MSNAECRHEWAEGLDGSVHCKRCMRCAPSQLALAVEVDRLRSVIATKAAIDKSSISPVVIARNEALAQAAEIAERENVDDTQDVARRIARRIRALIKP